MPSYSEIQAQIAELTKKAEAARKTEVSGVVAEIRKTIADYGLKPSDLFPGISASGAASSRKTASVKYRDAAGNTWTGRGKAPRWLQSAMDAGASRESFLIRS